MIKIGIAGVTGYTGGELLRLLLNHPRVEIVKASSRSNAGGEVSDVHRSLKDCIHLIESDFYAEDFATGLDAAFLALPHGASAELAAQLLAKGVKVIDLGADFRLKNADEYRHWYGAEHKFPHLLPESIYGLPELNRAALASAELVANPGCFPTASLLALLPLFSEGIIKSEGIIVDAKSGVSGAGKTLTDLSHFPNMEENFLAYKVATHRHTAEIEQEAGSVAGENIALCFVPHLAPMSRGILATAYAEPRTKLPTTAELRELYQEYYREDYFVRLRAEDELPETKWVRGSNFCDITPLADERTNRIIVVSAIDNLVKGASGQAVQNMNLLFDLPEEEGLKYPGLFP